MVAELSVIMKATISTEAESAPATGSKSLQELSTVKAVTELIRHPDCEETFFALDDFLQQLIFKQFCAEFKRLQTVEEEFKTLEEHCPAADRQLWSQRWKPIWNPVWEGDDDDDLEDWSVDEELTNGHCISDKMRKEWTLLEVTGEPGKHARYKHPEEKWTHRDFVRQSPDSPLQTHCRRSQRVKMAYFDEFISAQLLLYRLVSLFDLFPLTAAGSRESGKSITLCGGLTLVRQGDERCWIRFLDHVGEPRVQFEGTKESGALALELVNFIISSNVPLANGKRAGTFSKRQKRIQ